jgi:hypothetical protein
MKDVLKLEKPKLKAKKGKKGVGMKMPKMKI